MKKPLAILTVWMLPILVFAQTTGKLSGTAVGNWLDIIFDIVGFASYLLMGIATAVFLWGMVKYIMAGADEKAKEASKGYIKAGIIGLFLSLAVWGIVYAIARTFDVADSGIPFGPGNLDPRKQ
ncbi:MAG TPA: pilin [Candidatus Paceibacterota bacterium]